MGRNICIFSDATGQAGGNSKSEKRENSNVYRLWRACRPDGGGVTADLQIAFYDPGLGSDPDADKRDGWIDGIYKWVSQASGFGITWNIIDCYAFLIENWKPGDRIYLFGFSRGAYTVRSLGGVLKLCGIPSLGPGITGDAVKPEARKRAEEAVKNIYMVYGMDKKELRLGEGKKFMQKYGAEASQPLCAPYFIGVWDTVRALGVKGLNSITDLAKHAFHDDALDARVPYARQALAIDENRQTFKPELWDETKKSDGQDIRQVWFAGAHTDVGGGYKDFDGLSGLTLAWMASEAASLPHPLLINQAKLAASGNPLAPQHDETKTSWIPYSEKNRAEFTAKFNLQADSAVDQRFGKQVQAAVSRGGFEPVIYKPDALRAHHRFSGRF